MPVAGIVEARSAVRLRKGQTLKQWSEEHPDQSTFDVDIIGDGYPALFDGDVAVWNGQVILYLG
jgi:hypothetical protein